VSTAIYNVLFRLPFCTNVLKDASAAQLYGTFTLYLTFRVVAIPSVWNHLPKHLHTDDICH